MGGRRRGALEYERLLEKASPELAAADTSRDDVALWLYTSGSTGRPKAAVHLHHDLVHAAELVGRGVFGIAADDVILSASKLHFAFGLGNSLYFPALVGATSVLVPERPEAERIFELIQAERPTLLFAVATVYRRLLQVEGAERRFDLSSLRLCVSSGEALPAAIFHAWKSRFGHELLDVMGSTEALHDYIANRPGEARPGSSGRVIPGYEARLVDDQDRPVAPGFAGQLLIKGDSTAAGYWNRHERTRATMQGEWLRTGDMFYQDGDGYFYFCGRADDMLKVGGMWVSPVEIEACLGEHPAVLEAAVVGRGDADGLTKAHAFCVLRDGRSRHRRARRRAAGAGAQAPGRLQVAALGGLRGRAAQDHHRQDPAVRACGGARMRVVVERVSKTYVDRRGRDVVALSQVDFAVEPEEFVALLGPSGCGKSTLLNIIGGLLPASAGRVYFEGEPRDGRPMAATVFQEFALFPVAHGARQRGVRPGRARASRASSGRSGRGTTST